MSIPLNKEDSRWRLMESVINSPLFNKSFRLCNFLRFVCEMELTGRRSEINEHRIGVAVFERALTYNPAEDSIVRSQARVLRQRLEEYFRTIGKHDSMRIVIAKGNYIPAFEENRPADSEVQPIPESQNNSGIGLPKVEHGQFSWHRRAIFASLVLAACSVSFLLLYRSVNPEQSLTSRFWNTIFAGNRRQVIVPSDISLPLLLEFTNKQVSLQDYLSHDYATKNQEILRYKDLLPSRFTSVANLSLVAQLVRMPEIKHMRAEIRFARDLSMSDAKEANLVIIGGPAANPWWQLFTNNMNFSLDYNRETHQIVITDKSPRKTEQSVYTEEVEGNATRVYGLISFGPSLDNQGSVLMVAGTTSPGTQAAVDFILNHELFDQFLRRIQRPDGSIPHFELLLQALDINSDVTHSQIIAYRIRD